MLTLQFFLEVLLFVDLADVIVLLNQEFHAEDLQLSLFNLRSSTLKSIGQAWSQKFAGLAKQFICCFLFSVAYFLQAFFTSHSLLHFLSHPKEAVLFVRSLKLVFYLHLNGLFPF